MTVLGGKAKFLCGLMVVVMVTISIPCRTVSAAVIPTGAVADSVRGGEARDQLKHFFAREDVQAVLIAQGLDPVEASSRIGALTDEEVVRLADQIDALPAGGSTLLLVGAAILVATIIAALRLSDGLALALALRIDPGLGGVISGLAGALLAERFGQPSRNESPTSCHARVCPRRSSAGPAVSTISSNSESWSKMDKPFLRSSKLSAYIR